MNEMLEAVTALWAGDHVSYAGQFYQFEDLSLEPKPVQRPHPPIWIGGGTQPSEKIYGQQVDTIRPVLRRIAKYASTWVPHSSATADMVAGGLGDHPRGDDRVRARPGRDDQGLFELRPRPGAGRVAEPARPRKFQTFSGMDLDYWQEFYLLGEAEALAERIRGKIDALGGVEHVILNPLDWSHETLDRLASDVLPLVRA